MHKFDPSSAQRLERPERYALLPPREVLQQFGVSAGMTVADLGAGTGFFARAAADVVGPEGRVYAIDMSQDMLDYLGATGIPAHVHLVLSGEYRVPLPNAIADLVLIAFVTHETPDIPRFLAEAARLTKAGGAIAIVDWKKQQEENGPEMQERLDEEDLVRQIGSSFTIRDRGSLNRSHYYLILHPGGS
jgi:ubiquinone/menaquinone biosynthesis C-methylase UbiE